MFPDFMTTAQGGGKVVSLTHRPHLHPGNPPGTHFCQGLSRKRRHKLIETRPNSTPNYQEYKQLKTKLRTAFFWHITQRIVVIPYRHFRTTYRYQPQGSRIQKHITKHSWPLTGCPETFVRNCHYSSPNNPEVRSSHLLRVASLKSRIAEKKYI